MSYFCYIYQLTAIDSYLLLSNRLCMCNVHRAALLFYLINKAIDRSGPLVFFSVASHILACANHTSFLYGFRLIRALCVVTNQDLLEQVRGIKGSIIIQIHRFTICDVKANSSPKKQPSKTLFKGVDYPVYMIN